MIEIKVRKLLHFSAGKKDLNINLQIPERSFNTIFGKSGAGKTTILRMLAGLTKPDTGYIKVGGNYWYSSEKKTDLSPQKRRIGYVFQDFALFPNMTVKENLVFALGSKNEKKWVEEILEITDLKNLSDNYITSLSGGQQQRVALARALVRQPDILLLDEPLSALDFETRAYLQDEISKIHQRFNLTTILISHNKNEIKKMSDQVFHLEQGEIIESGRPGDLFPELPSLQGTLQEISIKEDHMLLAVRSDLTGENKTATGEKFLPGQELIITLKKG